MHTINYIVFSALLFGCGQNKSTIQLEKRDSVQLEPIQQVMIQSKDTIVVIGKTDVWIRSPEGEIKADILVLPGWNFAKEKICKESDFCDKALANGYRLILPEMMKSVYASNYFPETRSDYKSLLTLTWVTDTMIPALQKDFAIFSGKNNYLHGISTGSRGAALVHMSTGKLFSKVVLLSGDYDQTKMSNDNLMKNTYGPYATFKERWETTDNPFNLSTNNWTAQLYIAHGGIDEVVPQQQSIDFANKIEREHPTCKLIKNFPECKHDFGFWGGETDKILKFFGE